MTCIDGSSLMGPFGPKAPSEFPSNYQEIGLNMTGTSGRRVATEAEDRLWEDFIRFPDLESGSKPPSYLLPNWVDV